MGDFGRILHSGCSSESQVLSGTESAILNRESSDSQRKNNAACIDLHPDGNMNSVGVPGGRFLEGAQAMKCTL